MRTRTIASWALVVLGVIASVGSAVLMWAGRAKMGMARFLIHRSRQLEGALPMEACRPIMLAVGAVCLVVVAVLVMRRWRTWRAGARVVVVIALVLSAACILTCATSGYPELRSFYLSAPLLALGSLLGMVAVAIAPRGAADAGADVASASPDADERTEG